MLIISNDEICYRLFVDVLHVYIFSRSVLTHECIFCYESILYCCQLVSVYKLFS